MKKQLQRVISKFEDFMREDEDLTENQNKKLETLLIQLRLIINQL